MRNRVIMSAALGLALLSAAAVWAGGGAAEEQALQARSKALVAAFNRGDAKAIAEFWTENGDYMDELGRRYQGRKAIADYFQKLFVAGKGAELRVHRTAFRLVGPDLAIGDGIMEVIPPGGAPPTHSRYTAVQVKRDGEWLIESVREAVVTAPAHSEKLEELSWLIGGWANENNKGPAMNFSFSWAENNHFIVGHFATTLQNVPVAGGTQWIAWDAASKSIRSWVFDSTGSISEATWARDGNRLTSSTTTTLPDGKRATATNIVTLVDPLHLSWQSTRRAVDGKELPDTEVVTLKRVQ